MIYSRLLSNQIFEFLRMIIPYIHMGKGLQKLRKIWFLIQKVFQTGLD